MSARPRGLAPLVVVVAAGALVTVLSPPVGGADSAPALRAHAEALQSAGRSALLQLYAAESALGRARADETQLETRSHTLAAEEQTARRRTEVVRRSLAASHARVARTLRALYMEGSVDPVAVILGAGSLDELVQGVEILRRTTAQNRRLAEQAGSKAQTLRALQAQLASRRRALDAARARSRAATQRSELALAHRAATVASLRRESEVTAGRLKALAQQARAAVRTSEKLTVAATDVARVGRPPVSTTQADAVAAVDPVTDAQPADPASAAQIVPGDVELAVDAVAYHLPGRTASGLPVGLGVIAVDPAVIPLGTRVFVPGYGTAVAADTGTAIRGNIIDLWMPTTAQARAWGRRAVTITVYGS